MWFQISTHQEQTHLVFLIFFAHVLPHFYNYLPFSVSFYSSHSLKSIKSCIKEVLKYIYWFVLNYNTNVFQAESFKSHLTQEKNYLLLICHGTWGFRGAQNTFSQRTETCPVYCLPGNPTAAQSLGSLRWQHLLEVHSSKLLINTSLLGNTPRPLNTCW